MSEGAFHRYTPPGAAIEPTGNPDAFRSAVANHKPEFDDDASNQRFIHCERDLSHRVPVPEEASVPLPPQGPALPSRAVRGGRDDGGTDGTTRDLSRANVEKRAELGSG
ncbi:MAG: hypothetical protein OXG51_05280 [Gammaproteobacteria bacterium]|nr:hypothetical protein [Gammaproteobacteria bacterium]